jgi:peptidoglycan/LPS O-acetylase OafA/YrhL
VDGAYWSLLVEFRFYLVFAVVYFFIGQNRPAVRRFSWMAVLLLGTLAFWPPTFGQGRARDFAQYLPFFAFGLAAYQVQSGDRLGLAGLGLSIALTCAYAAASIETISVPFGWDSVVAYIVLMCFALLAFQWRAAGPQMFFAPVRFVAAISYPLYLIHQDLGLLTISRISALGPLAAKSLAILGAVLIAVVVHYLIELPVISLDSRMRAKAFAAG